MLGKRWLRGGARGVALCACAAGLACGGGDAEVGGDAGGAGEPAAAGLPVAPDACALLTLEEASEALGEAAAAPQPGLNPAPAEGAAAVMSACNYPSAQSAKAIGVTAWRAANGMYSSAALDGARQSLREATGQPPREIPGMGVVAFWGGGQLHVVKDGNNYFILAPSAFGDDATALRAALAAAGPILRAL